MERRGVSGRGRGRGFKGVHARRGSGRGIDRSSSIDPLLCTVMDTLPKSQPIKRSLHPKRRRNLAPKRKGPRLNESALEMPGPSKVNELASDVCAFPSSSSSELMYTSLPLQCDTAQGDEIVTVWYGSEEDSDGKEDDVHQSRLASRVECILQQEDRDEDELGNTNTDVYLQWPLQLADMVPQLIEACQSASVTDVLEHPTPEGIPYEPTNKLKFCWQEFPENQTDPALRRETFIGLDCGPTTFLPTPYAAFTAIWDWETMGHIANQTNIYARHLQRVMEEQKVIRPNSRIKKWKDTDVGELYVYFGIILATGIIVRSRLEEYWNSRKDIFGSMGFADAMRYDRFQLLNRCLHFNNNDECNFEIMTRSQAKLYKLQPILDHLNNKFSSLYNMSQNIVLDESQTMSKIGAGIKQFIRHKKSSSGIKTFEVCESRTGYLWRLEVHDTSSRPQEDCPISGVVPSLVLKLLNGLEDKGHTVWMDNLDISPALARELKVRGFDCVGMLRTNRSFLPIELTNLNKNHLSAGQVIGCTSGDVDLVVWEDKSRVALISTYHGVATTKCGDSLKPSIVSDYNVSMRGVDRRDQILSMYPIERKSTKIWYKNLFQRLLNASVLNAYILNKTQQTKSHRCFRIELVTQLLAHHAPPAPSVVAMRKSPGHFPAQYDWLPGNNRMRQRLKCAVCKKRTSVFCDTCNVPLCNFTCFKPYHQPP